MCVSYFHFYLISAALVALISIWPLMLLLYEFCVSYANDSQEKRDLEKYRSHLWIAGFGADKGGRIDGSDFIANAFAGIFFGFVLSVVWPLVLACLIIFALLTWRRQQVRLRKAIDKANESSGSDE